MLFVPLGVGSSEEAVGAHFPGVGFFGVRARDDVDGGAEGFGEQETQVADAAEADDADFLAGAAAVADQRGVGGETGAEHGSGDGGGEGVGDWEDPIISRGMNWLVGGFKGKRGTGEGEREKRKKRRTSARGCGCERSNRPG